VVTFWWSFFFHHPPPPPHHQFVQEIQENQIDGQPAVDEEEEEDDGSFGREKLEFQNQPRALRTRVYFFELELASESTHAWPSST